MSTQLAASQAAGDARARLALRRHFTTPGAHPYDEVAWERRSAGIQAEGGQAVFEQDDIEVPKDWSQLATNVVASKYFRGQLGSPRRESSIRQLIDRIVLTLRTWGEEEGYFADVVEADTFEAELTHLLVQQKMAFNSPVWFNMGTRENPQSSACQPYGALISTPRGMVPIGEIVEGEQIGLEVYDPDGVTHVVAVKANGQKPVHRVRLRNGSFVEATADHVVKAVHERRTTPEWMRVDELRPGMRMHLHPHRAKVVDRPLVAAGVGSHIVADMPELTLDAIDELLVSEAALAGWLQAWGVQVSGAPTALRLRFRDDAEKEWLTENVKAAFSDLDLSIGDGELVASSADVPAFLETWSLSFGSLRTVPARVWTSTHEEIGAYLRAVFQAQGRTSPVLRLAVEHGERWAEEIQNLLGALGIYSARHVEDHVSRITIDVGSEIARFTGWVGFIDDSRQQRELHEWLGRADGHCPDLREEEIVAIEPVGVQEVYDIQTESGEYLTNHVAVHNCFILSVDDTMDSILSWIGKEGIIFKGGSGSGINLSKIRSSREHLSGGGTASGPVSFMRGADSCAGAIKSGGTTRRAAKMVILNCDHPDITDFVECKATEEKKAWALGEMGYDMGINGEVWNSIQFQNANNSVRVTDEFMLAVEAGKEWHTKSVTTGEVMDTFPARDLMRKVAEAAWVCGDPGMQYDSTINQWHTCPNSGRINGSNPCFPADVRVHTTLGLIPIGELYERAQFGEDFRVYTHRATAETPGEGVEATVPVAIMKTGVKPIVRLRFSGGQELRCTPNHRLWTTNRGYVAAEDLTPDDRVMLNDSATPAVDASWELPVRVVAEAKSFSRGGTATRQRLPERWSEGLGELLGHLVGDGWLTDVQTGWVYGGDDIADGLEASHEGLIRELVGGVSRQEISNGTVQLRVGSAAVRELFGGLGVTTARAHDKRVPVSVFAAPVEVQAAFLRGLFGADGCIHESAKTTTRYVGLGSSSESLLTDTQRLLSAFGIRARIYRTRKGVAGALEYQRKDGTCVTYESRQLFDLRIMGEDLEKFVLDIGFSTPRKQDALETMLGRTRRYKTRSWIALTSRETDGQEWVYNLNEPLHHSYICNGIPVANCSEYMHLDDSACNLASLNLMKFVDDEDGFLVEDFQQAVDVTITAMDIIVTRSGYPTEAIGANARAFRQLGLGYANLGALLMSNGMPYDSDAGRAYAGAVTSLMTGRAYEMSTRLSERMGPFDGYAVNAQPMQGVMRMHLRAVEEINEQLVPDGGLLGAAREAWRNVVDRGPVHGIRNSQASVLAPTGTIGFMMDCDTTGVEPDIALVKYKKLVGGGVIKLVNNTVPRALRKLGYSEAEVEAIVQYVDEHETIEGAPALRDEHLAVFDCAFTPLKGTRSINYSGHIKMMGAVQPFISGAISKTVNMPNEATPEEIAGAYQLAWKEGVKALAIYRDGSKRTQPLSTGKALPEPTQAARPVRRRMPDEREAITHHFSIADHDGYVTVGKYEDGSPGEVFMKMAKQGSTVAGLMDSLAICMSLALQHGVPLQVMADKLSHMRFEPSGFTGNPEIPMAKSIVDYLVRWLSAKFLSEDEKRQVGIITDSLRAEAKALADHAAALRIDDDDATPAGKVIELPAAQPSAGSTSTPGQTEIPLSPAQGGAYTFRMQTDGAICSSCGWTMIRSGSCYKCENCGSTSGCS